jgi:hypothetical protein
MRPLRASTPPTTHAKYTEIAFSHEGDALNSSFGIFVLPRRSHDTGNRILITYNALAKVATGSFGYEGNMPAPPNSVTHEGAECCAFARGTAERGADQKPIVSLWGRGQQKIFEFEITPCGASFLQEA